MIGTFLLFDKNSVFVDIITSVVPYLSIKTS